MDNVPTHWIQYGALGLVAFMVVSGVSISTWIIKHVVPKQIEAFNENVKLQKVMSETLTVLAERLSSHDGHSVTLAANIRTDIRDLRDHLVIKMDEHGRKIDRILERG